MPEPEHNPIALPLRRSAQLKRVLNGEHVNSASLAVGYKSARTGQNALRDTRKRLLDAMDHLHLTPEGLVRDYLLPMLNATSTQYFAKDGVVMDERTDPDNAIRLAALRDTFKLGGMFPKEQSDGPNHLAITINNAVVTTTGDDE